MKNFINDASNDMQLKGLKEPINNRLLTFEDPNNAPPSDTELMQSTERRPSLLFESSTATTKVSRHVRNRTETFSHSSRPFALTEEIPVAHTSSTPGAIQRRPTVSGLEIRMNRNSALSDHNSGGILEAFGPGLFSTGWDNFTPTNQSPLSGLISSDASGMQAPAPTSAVETVVSAIDFLDIVGPSSFQLVEDPFNPFSSSGVDSYPNTQSRMRSYSSAFVNQTKPTASVRHRSISIPEKQMRLELDIMKAEVGFGSSYIQVSKAAPKSVQPESDSSPTRSLWVGNLDSNISQNELLAIFAPYGSIDSIRMIPERECAFINFMTVEDASKAKMVLSGSYIGNSIIKIAYGKADVSIDYIANNASKSLCTFQLFIDIGIGNIPSTLEPVDLEKIFGCFGPIESARVLSHKNCGFINFVRQEDAAEARKQMNGKEISGAFVKIGFAKVPSNQVTPTVSSLPESGNEWSVDNSPSSLGWPQSVDTTHAVQSLGIIHASTIPGLPPFENRLDNNAMREFRKRLENSNITSDQVAEIFNAVIFDAAAVSADYIGNVVIQKLIEKGTDDQRLQIIQQVAPFIASIGIHKNGTWAMQKILDTIEHPYHIELVVEAITPYTPLLLLDQYGNYVVQCCLRFRGNQNQFIFEAISSNILKIGLARFGARATRTCLESQFTSKAQQKLVASSIIKNCFELSCDQNGALLTSWLLDSYTGAGKYSELVLVFKSSLVSACTHKIASAFVLKMCVQKSEPEARDSILDDVFSKNLIPILLDPVNGTSLIRKILTNSPNDQPRLLSLMSRVISKSDVQRHASIKRFTEEFSILVNNDSVSR